MKHNILLLSILITVLFSCEDITPGEREFPIIRTLEVADIDESGATFQGELVKEGSSEISSYGFVWRINEPSVNDSFKVTLGTAFNSPTFKIRIDSSLVNGLEYNVRTFATYGNKTVYGNNMKFVSQGSAKNAWSMEVRDVLLNGSFAPYGSSDNETGTITYSSAKVYTYDPEEKEISTCADIPVQGNSGTRFTSAAIGNTQYFISSTDRNLYTLREGSWAKRSNIPFSYAGFHLAFSFSDSIFMLGSNLSYLYDVTSDAWIKKKGFSQDSEIKFAGGTALKNKAYLVASNRDIWEYNTGNDSWILKTKYPGVLHDKIISFSLHNKLYFGLSHSANYTRNWFERKLWMYDPVKNTWDSTQEFPVELDYGELFFFSIKGKLYMGAGIQETYSIWKFDASKS